MKRPKVIEVSSSDSGVRLRTQFPGLINKESGAAPHGRRCAAPLPLRNNGLNSGVDRAECGTDGRSQTVRTGHNCHQHCSQHQRVLEQVLTRLFPMELASEL